MEQERIERQRQVEKEARERQEEEERRAGSFTGRLKHYAICAAVSAFFLAALATGGTLTLAGITALSALTGMDPPFR